MRSPVEYVCLPFSSASAACDAQHCSVSAAHAQGQRGGARLPSQRSAGCNPVCTCAAQRAAAASEVQRLHGLQQLRGCGRACRLRASQARLGCVACRPRGNASRNGERHGAGSRCGCHALQMSRCHGLGRAWRTAAGPGRAWPPGVPLLRAQSGVRSRILSQAWRPSRGSPCAQPWASSRWTYASTRRARWSLRA